MLRFMEGKLLTPFSLNVCISSAVMHDSVLTIFGLQEAERGVNKTDFRSVFKG